MYYYEWKLIVLTSHGRNLLVYLYCYIFCLFASPACQRKSVANTMLPAAAQRKDSKQLDSSLSPRTSGGEPKQAEAPRGNDATSQKSETS
jgi:hypothetical protein